MKSAKSDFFSANETGITLKLFLIIAVSLVGFISATFALQAAFFERFYIQHKAAEFEKAFAGLAEAVQDSEISGESLESALDDFSERHAAWTALSDAEAVGTSRRYMANFPGADEIAEFVAEDSAAMRIAPGQTEFRKIPRRPGRSDEMVYGASRLVRNGHESILFSAISMQSVGDAASALKTFYVYVYAAAIALALLIALLASRLLARPLIASNIRLKEFITSASHELKTPIGLISGYAEALRDGAPPEHQAEFLDIISDETGKMDALVRSMLELSHLQDSRPALKLDVVQAGEIIEWVLRKFSMRLAEKQIEVKLELCAGLLLRVDSLIAEQAVANLADNAIRYVPAGGRITIGTLISETSSGMAGIWIENEGPQIPDADLTRIFESFYRADKSRTRQTGNYGIGLAIAYAAAKRHGGRLIAENTQTGVKFSLVLPRG